MKPSKERGEEKVKKIRLKNFMSIEDSTIEFDESNIISLCGYNDSGKSAVTRALEVMFFNSYSMDQVNFITDTIPGVEYWEVSIEFKDGVVYTRRKYIDGGSEWELERDGELIFTNRLPNGSLAAMADTPEPIREYLGVIQDEVTDEKLNVRRNTDRLFLIETTGGDNYKMLNSILKSEVISEASRQLNEDKNKLNGDIASTKAKKEYVVEQLEELPVIPENIQEQINLGVQRFRGKVNQIIRVKNVIEVKDKLDGVEVNPSIGEVGISKVEALRGIAERLEIKERPITPEVKEIKTGVLQDLVSVIKAQEQKDKIEVVPRVEDVKVEQLQILQEVAKQREIVDKVQDNPEVVLVGIDKVKDLESVIKVYNTYVARYTELKKTEQELEQSRVELEQIAKENNLKTCGTCGSLT